MKFKCKNHERMRGHKGKQIAPLAGELFAAQLEAVQVAKHGDCDRVGKKEFIGKFPYFFGGDTLDFLNQFVHAVEAIEVHLLPSQAGHARSRGLERQHQAALSVDPWNGGVLRREHLPI